MITFKHTEFNGAISIPAMQRNKPIRQIKLLIYFKYFDETTDSGV